MSKADATSGRKFATLTPVDDPEQLKSWWRPSLPEDAYSAHKVKVLSLEKTQDTVFLNFELVGDEARKQQLGPFRVDLHRAPQMVWPELPSTAAQAKAGQYAFLLLTDEWYRNNQLKPGAFAEPGNKWPFGAMESNG